MSIVRRGGAIAIRNTSDSLLVRLGDGEEVWVPNSVIHEDSMVCYQGDEGTLIVLGWWAEKQEWEEEDDDDDEY